MNFNIFEVLYCSTSYSFNFAYTYIRLHHRDDILGRSLLLNLPQSLCMGCFHIKVAPFLMLATTYTYHASLFPTELFYYNYLSMLPHFSKPIVNQ